jgi:hypothetical protein
MKRWLFYCRSYDCLRHRSELPSRSLSNSVCERKKKPASVAGCLSLRLNISRLVALFFSPPGFNPPFVSSSS